MADEKQKVDLNKTKTDLLGLDKDEKAQLIRIQQDYQFYIGCYTKEDRDKYSNFVQNDMLGQTWFLSEDKLDYIPSVVVDNKVSELIGKQARFFLGVPPYLLFKLKDNNIGGDNSHDKDKLERFRVFIDSILDDNQFWSNMLKAFRLATVTKRILLRIEANPGEDIKLYYHDVCDFNYRTDKQGRLVEVKFVTYIGYDETKEKEMFKRFTYFLVDNMRDETNTEIKCRLKEEYFYHDDLENPFDESEVETIYSRIPAVVFINEPDLFEPSGKSDVTLLKGLQNQYNRKLSDFSDALRFQMFGNTTFIDATEETVNVCKIAPNSVFAVETTDEAKEHNMQAQVHRTESSFSNAEPVMSYLQMLRDSMGDKLAIPKKDELKEVPSAKALKFIYNDLIARCHEKWQDWEPGIFTIIDLIIESCSKLNIYEDFQTEWLNLEYTMLLKKNFPIPDDEEDAKRLAMEEVNNNVRSHRNYLKDYGTEEDYNEAFKEIVEDLQIINESEMDPISKSLVLEQQKNNSNLENGDE